MRNVLSIAGREILSSFVTPLAYVVIAGFLVISGFFFFTLVQQFNSVLYQAAMMPSLTPNLNEWVVVPFYQTLLVVLIFLLPILTMRSLAEEKQQGTFELLTTAPLSIGEIVLGKFLGVSAVVLFMLLLSAVFPAVLIFFTDPEVMPVIVGFFGLSLFALSFTAIGMAVSAFTKSQTIAGVVGLVLFLLIFVIDAPAASMEGALSETLNYMAPSRHAEEFFKGVISSSSLCYFLSLMILGLFVTSRALEAQRWR